MNANVSSNDFEMDQLQTLVMELAEFAYSFLTDLPDEEEWGMRSKLRQRAFDSTSDLAEAYGSIDPRDAKYYFGLARRSLFGIKNVYTLANQVHGLKVDPEIMLKIDKAIRSIDTKIERSSKEIPKWLKQFGSEDKAK